MNSGPQPTGPQTFASEQFGPSQPWQEHFDLATAPHLQTGQEAISAPSGTLSSAPDFSERYHEAVKSASGPWDYLDKVMGFGWGEAMRRVESWGLEPGPKGAAKAQDILALSHMTGANPVFVADNYEAITQKMGLQEFPPAHELIPEALKLGAGVIGLETVPLWKLALGVAGYTAEQEANRFVRSRIEGTPFSRTRPYSLLDLAPYDASELTKTTLAVMDLIGKGALLDAGFKGLKWGWRGLTIQTIIDHGLPRKFYVDPDTALNVMRGHSGTPEMEFRALGITADELRQARGQGFQLEIPADKLITVQDRPWYGALKRYLSISPYSETRVEPGGPRKVTPVGGLFEAPKASAEKATEAPDESLKPETGETATEIPKAFSGAFDAAVERYPVPRDIFARLIAEESGWDETAESPKGARGLAQLMPETAAELGVEPDDPEQNLMGGAKYFHDQLARFGGDVVRALVAYNWGPEHAAMWNGEMSSLPEETRDYVERILGKENIPEGAVRSVVHSAILENRNIPDPQKYIMLGEMEARAMRWSARTGKPPEEWYSRYLADMDVPQVGGETGRKLADIIAAQGRTVAASDHTLELPPSGDFGPEYTQFSGKPDEAIDHLIAQKQGEVPAAIDKEGLGPIDLVWGKGGAKGYGLAHVIEKHGEEVAKQIPQIIRDGEVLPHPATSDRAIIETRDHQAIIRLDWNGRAKRWLVTAYEKSPRSGRTSDFDRTYGADKAPSARGDFGENITLKADQVNRGKDLEESGDLTQKQLRTAGTRSDLNRIIRRLRGKTLTRKDVSARRLYRNKLSAGQREAYYRAIAIWHEHDGDMEAISKALDETEGKEKAWKSLLDILRSERGAIGEGKKRLFQKKMEAIKNAPAAKASTMIENLVAEAGRRSGNALYEMNRELDRALFDESEENDAYSRVQAEAAARAAGLVKNTYEERLTELEKHLAAESEHLYRDDPRTRMIRELQKGAGISRRSLNDWDKDRVTDIVRKFPAIVKSKGGFGLDEVAMEYGYPDGDTLFRALYDYPTMEQFRDRHVNEGLAAQAPDLLDMSEAERNQILLAQEIYVLNEKARDLGASFSSTQKSPAIPNLRKVVDAQTGVTVADLQAKTDYDNLKAAMIQAERAARSAYNEGMRTGAAIEKARGSEKVERTARDWMWRALKEKLRQKQLLDNFQGRVKAREETRELVAKIRKIRDATNLPLDYREQIGGILSSVGAAQIKTPEPVERMSLTKWMEKKEEEGEPPFGFDPEALGALRGKTIRDMTLSGLHALYEALNEIYTRGRNEGKALASAEKASLDERASEASARIIEKHSAKGLAGRSVKYGGRIFPLEVVPGMDETTRQTVLGLRNIVEYGGKADAIKGLQELIDDPETPDDMKDDLEVQTRAVRSIDETKIKMPEPSLRPWDAKEGLIKRVLSSDGRILSHLVRMENAFRYMDGFTEAPGPNWKYLYKPLNGASDGRLVSGGYNGLYLMNNEDLPALNEILAPFKTKGRGLGPWLNEKYIFKWGKVGMPIDKMEMMSWALNCGNEGNYSALKRSFRPGGRNLTDEMIQEVTWKLSRDEWDTVERLWNLVDSPARLDATAQVYLIITGNRLPKVQGSTVKTPYGDLAGHYYPLVDDPGASYRLEKRFAQNEMRNLFAFHYGNATTRRGFTISRVSGAEHVVEKNFPMVVTRFIQDRNRYIALTLPVRDVQKLANRVGYQTTVEHFIGKPYHRQIVPWLQDVARPSVKDAGLVAGIASFLRSAGTMVHIGFKLVTAAKHETMLATTFDRIKNPAIMQKAICAYLKHPLEIREFAHARSPYMRNIAQRWQRDLAEKFRNFDPAKSDFRDFIAKMSFLPIDIVIEHVADVSWTAGYIKAMEKYGWDESKAIDYADQVVRDTVGSSEAKDLPALMRGGELQKLFTMFCAYGITLFQRGFERTKQIGIKGTTGEEKDRPVMWKRWFALIGTVIGLCVVSGIIENIMSNRRMPTEADLLKAPLDAAASAIPRGDVIEGFFGVSSWRPEPVPAFDVLTRGWEFFHPLVSGKFKWDQYQYENLMTVGGYAMRAPTDFLATFSEGIYDWNEPDYHPWNLFIKPPYHPHARHIEGLEGFTR